MINYAKEFDQMILSEAFLSNPYPYYANPRKKIGLLVRTTQYLDLGKLSRRSRCPKSRSSFQEKE